jgi:hypothetical protein
MQLKEIRDQLIQLEESLVQLGAIAPDAMLGVKSVGSCYIHLGARNGGAPVFGSDDYKVFFGDTPEECFAEARDFISKIQDPRTEQRRQWQKKLGEVIDEGHDLELPNEVMGPLHAGSQAMTDNLLEDQSDG